MPSQKDKSENDKVFDVTKPGETPADPTARPVIVGHAQGLKQDPMVKEDPDVEQSSSAPPIKKGELKLQPLSASAPAEKSDEPESPAEEKPTVESTAPSEEPEQASAVDVLADEAAKTHSDKESEAALQRQKEIEKAIASNKYHVKIRTPKAKRTALWGLLFLLLAAAGAGGYMFFGPGKELLM